jgi:hypothetical protein
MATRRDLDDVEYQPPGSSEWRRVSDLLPKAAQARSARASARRLLVEGEGIARYILRRSHEEEKSESEVAELERDMAAALGDFDRFVTAAARKLKYDAEDVVRDLRSKKK